MLPQGTDSSFKLSSHSKIGPSKSICDLDCLYCVSRLFGFWDTNINPCLWYGTWNKEGERRRKKNSFPLLVTGSLWCLLEKDLMASKLPMLLPWFWSSRARLPTHQPSSTEAPSLQLQSWQSCCTGSETNKYYTYCTLIFPASASCLFPSLLWSILHPQKSGLEWSYTFIISKFQRKLNCYWF